MASFCGLDLWFGGGATEEQLSDDNGGEGTSSARPSAVDGGDGGAGSLTEVAVDHEYVVETPDRVIVIGRADDDRDRSLVKLAAKTAFNLLRKRCYLADPDKHEYKLFLQKAKGKMTKGRKLRLTSVLTRGVDGVSETFKVLAPIVPYDPENGVDDLDVALQLAEKGQVITGPRSMICLNKDDFRVHEDHAEARRMMKKHK